MFLHYLLSIPYYIGRKYGFIDIREKLYQISQFIDVVDLKGNTVIWALTCSWKDYEDAVQFKNAINTFADCIVTRNKKDFSESDLPVYTVKELLESLS